MPLTGDGIRGEKWYKVNIYSSLKLMDRSIGPMDKKYSSGTVRIKTVGEMSP